jgi:dihydropyrimidinase
MMHDLAGYTPYAGRKLRAGRRPCYRAARHRVGRQAVGRGGFRTFAGARGREAAKPGGRLVPDMDPKQNFGARLL